jgi:MFS family permease
MRPFAYPIFRWLLLANVLSEIGTWMQYVGAEWLITSQTLDPLQVSLLGTAYRLPLFLLGIPAGIWGDTFGRRKVLLAAQFWMVVLAFAMVCLLRLNALGPWALIFLSFALFCGITLQGPALHAVYPELVPRQDSPAAIVLHSVAFNFTRVIGPVLGGVMIRWWGLTSTFTANVVSFAGLIWFLLAWRPQQETESRGETFGAACKSGVDYVRGSPALKVILAFAALQAFFAVAAEVLMPLMARSKLHLASDGLGLLVSCIGVGSILGALIVVPALGAFPATRVMSAGLLLSSISLFAFTRASHPLEAGLFLFANALGGAIASTLTRISQEGCSKKPSSLA